MPKVGAKHFSYGAKGVAAAKKEATRTGTPMTHTKPATAGSRTAPSSKASPMAAARSHGQRGAEMKAAAGGGRKMYPGGSKHFDESPGGPVRTGIVAGDKPATRNLPGTTLRSKPVTGGRRKRKV